MIEPRHVWSQSLETAVLLRRVQGGSSGAMDQLLDRYHSRVFRFVRRKIGKRLRTQLESGDVVQDVMVQVCRSVKGFVPRNERSFYRWLSQVVENRVRNLGRSQLRRPLTLIEQQELDEVEDNISSEEQAWATAQRLEDRQLLSRAMDSLSTDHSRLIRLRNYSGFSFARIGEKLGKSEDAAWMAHKRAKVELVKALHSLRHSSV